MIDLGKKISRYAKELSPAQLDTLLAVLTITVDIGVSTPIQRSFFSTDEYQPLLKRQLLIKRDPPAGWQRSRWAVSEITKLGMQVLLARVEQDLRHLGALPNEIVEPE